MTTCQGSIRLRLWALARCAAALALVILSLAVIPSLAQGTGVMGSEFPLPGEWPAYRGNGRLDGHSRLRGHITQPKVAWKQFVGAVDSWLVLIPSGRRGPERLSASPGRLIPPPPEDPRWGLTAPLGEIAGTQQPIVQNTTVTYAHVLPDRQGLQKLEFESAFSRPRTNGAWAHDCVGRCFAWQNGAWVQVWQTEPIDGLFSPQPIVGDFDGDGAQEVAILPWKELLILDARTGKVKDRCAFTDGRSYGFIGAYDLDGGGKSEFVVQADFAKHVDVLGYRHGKLSLLWREEIETDISNPQKILRVPPNPVVDLEGNGRKAVLVSVYNATGNGRWHLIVRDGISGTIRFDLADEYLQGVADLNGDGASELLTVHTSGAGVPEYGSIRVWSLKGGQARALWHGDGMAWQTWRPPLPLHINSAATLGDQDLLHRTIGGQTEVVLRRRVPGKPESTALAVARWHGGRFETLATIEGRDIDAIGMDPEGRILVRSPGLPDRPSPVKIGGGEVETLGSTLRGVPAVSAAIVHDPQRNRPVVIAQGPLGAQQLVAFRAPHQGEPAHELWRIAGRSQGVNWPQSQMYGPVVADLNGDGSRQHLYAATAPKGCARLVAATLTNQEIWHHDFPDIPGTAPIWNTGGLVMWQTGHFTDRRRLDVLVTVRRSMMHSEETLLLSGRDGRELWRRNRQIDNRGVGGTPFAIADYDGDGLDDIASLHPSELYLLHGATGRDILAKPAAWDGVPAKPVYWGVPIAGDFEGVGRNSLVFGTSNRSMTGLIRADGSLAWWDALDAATTCLPAIGNFTGHGKPEIVGLGFDDGIRCYDAATGRILWRMPSPTNQPAGEFASADINGDGRDEVLFTAANTLFCIGVTNDGAQGVLLWKIDLPATLGPPTIGDTEGDGSASVIVVGADGTVYCLR